VLRGAADMHVGISELCCERDELAAAREHLAAGARLGEHAGLPQNRHRRRIAMARVLQADGDLDGAEALLEEAQRLYVGDMFPDVRPVPALRARVWLAQGRLGTALDWVRDRRLSADDDLSYLREFEHVTLARALLAEHAASGNGSSLRQAAGLLGRLLAAAQDGGRTGSVIELLVLQALALRGAGDVPAALGALDRALELAEPEGYVRVFLDEGPPLAALLSTCARRGPATGYAHRLLGAGAPVAEAVPAPRGPIEPLSTRELEVLRLLGTDLDGPGIARELFISLNTVRTHTKNVYAKLGVTNRRAAVRRAVELELLTRPHG